MCPRPDFFGAPIRWLWNYQGLHQFDGGLFLVLEVGTGVAVNWPSGVGAKGNAGVAVMIKKREGAIGYLN